MFVAKISVKWDHYFNFYVNNVCAVSTCCKLEPYSHTMSAKKNGGNNTQISSAVHGSVSFRFLCRSCRFMYRKTYISAHGVKEA